MTSETKICQNCKQNFVIEPEDFEFYEKVKVPAPTFCPQCRLQRRLAWLNFFYLYKRKCDLCKKDFISMYPADASYRVYCPKCWWSDSWDPFSYGRDYDFSRTFFDQFNDLLHEAPLLGTSLGESALATSPYANHSANLKNCYLVFMADGDEDASYGFYILYSKSILDSSLISTCELMYDSMHSYKNNQCIGLRDQVTESLDCQFLRYSRNCQHCFASINLRNKKYYAFNKPYSKEEYEKFVGQYDLGSYQTYKKVQKMAEDHWKKYPPNPDVNERVTNCTGAYVFQSRNCQECYEVVGAENCKYLFLCIVVPTKDSYDISDWGENTELSYESCNIGEGVSRVKFCQESGTNLSNAEYCKVTMGVSYGFGCVGVRKAQYVILNRKYSKEEYEKLRARIIEQMNVRPYTDKAGKVYRYGEFFPMELSPFHYNTTLAYNFFPLAKEEVLHQNLGWREPDKSEYATTMRAEDLPDHIKEVSDSIMNEVIACIECGRGYRVIPSELAFRRLMNVPLARQCPFCRINEKFKNWIYNMTLNLRICDKCGKEFHTPHTKEQTPYILCKECYLKEVV